MESSTGLTKVKVRCTFEIEVEVPVEWDDVSIKNLIEDTGCPGTGLVDVKLQEIIEEHDKNNTCWACALRGTNEVISIERATL